MAAHFPSGASRIMRRDARVKRVHFTSDGITFCGKPKVEGDISFTRRGYAMRRNDLPGNMCKICARALACRERGDRDSVG